MGSIKKKRNSRNAKTFVNVYHASETLIFDASLKIMVFNEATEEWLDFILVNRSNNFTHGYDVVTGPVVNDTLYRTLTLFETGILTKAETIARLKVHRLFDQYSFHTTEALVYLNFVEVYR